MNIRNTVSNRLWLRRWSSFMLCLNSDRKDAPSICISHGSVLFLPSLKSNWNLRSNSAFRCGTTPVYSNNELLSATNNLPALQKNYVMYQFSCFGKSRYVGRTSHRLQNRIKQYVLKTICFCSSSWKRLLSARQCKFSTQTNTQSLAFDLAIGLHLFQHYACA